MRWLGTRIKECLEQPYEEHPRVRGDDGKRLEKVTRRSALWVLGLAWVLGLWTGLLQY